MQSKWLGRIDYSHGLEIQQETHGQVKSTGQSCILGCEHNPVITLGLRGNESVDLNQEEFQKKSSESLPEVFRVRRGGQATLHNPGQLVIYPIVDLRKVGFSLREFVYYLEDSTIEFLSHIGVSSRRCGDEPGISSEFGKIAAFGLRVQQGVTSHGLAINFSNDLDLFKLIRSCGVENRPQDLVANHLENFELKAMFELWCSHFERQLPAKEQSWQTPDTEGLEITEVLPKD